MWNLQKGQLGSEPQRDVTDYGRRLASMDVQSQRKRDWGEVTHKRALTCERLSLRGLIEPEKNIKELSFEMVEKKERALQKRKTLVPSVIGNHSKKKGVKYQLSHLRKQF